MESVSPPFWAEGPIPPARLATYFIGRSEDVERLRKRWYQRAPARSVILGPARTGKRSLVAASLVGSERDVVPVRVRVDRLLPGTPLGLVEALLSSFQGKMDRTEWMRLTRLAHYGPADDAPLEALRALAAPLDRIPTGPAKTPLRPVVVFEGAERLAELPEEALSALDDLLATTRAHVVALAAHVPSVLVERVPTLFGPTGTRTLRPATLSKKEATDFVRARFAAVQCQPAPEALELLLDYAAGDPGSLQLLGARCHDVLRRKGKGRLTEEDVVEGLYLALESLPPEWTRILGELKGRGRDVFVALAVLPQPNVATIGRRIHLDGKNVSVLLGRLVERGAPVEKVGRGRFRITHRLLAEWIKKEWAVVG
ncbi:MAG: ATP-binding protein [Euryarchaeota archaeon]|nr:ATP-binding protein [Euryarchaeota archaeon]